MTLLRILSLSVQGLVHWNGRASMLQSTLARGTRLAHNQRLIDRRKLLGKARAAPRAARDRTRDLQTPTAALRRQPPARDKPKDYPL
jgi:hypothetical protein